MLTKFRDTTKKFYYINSTQALANGLPSYTLGRNYKYSNYQQVINVMNIQFDQLNSNLAMHMQNRFAKTFNLNTIDVVYVTELPSSAGLFKINNGAEALEKSSFTNHEDWWYKTVPSSIKEIDSVDYSVILVDNAGISNRQEINQYLEIPSPLYIRIDPGAGSLVKIENGAISALTTVAIVGKDEWGNYKREEFSFSIDTVAFSKTKWLYVHAIESSFHSSDATLTVASYIDWMSESFIPDKALLRYTEDGSSKPVFWKWDSENNRLQQLERTANTVADYYSGIQNIEIVAEYDLKAYNDNDELISLSSVSSVLPGSDDNIYVISDGYLIAYKKYNEYPSIVKDASLMQTKDPLVELIVDIYPGKIIIKPEYNRIRLDKKISAYRFVVKDGDNTFYCVNPSKSNTADENNDWSQTEAWVDYSLKDKIGFYGPDAAYGGESLFQNDLLVMFQVITTAGTIETETYVVEKQLKMPLFQLQLPESYAPGMQLDYDERGIINLFNTSKRIKIAAAIDTYLEDANTGNVIFADNYSGLRYYTDESTYTTVSLSPFNVINELDSFAAFHAIERKSGEKNYNFIKRLEFIANNKPNSTRNGLINILSSELGLYVKPVAVISRTTPFNIDIKNNKVFFDNTAINFFLHNDIDSILDELEYNGFTVTDIDSSLINLTPRALLDITNRKYYKNFIFPGTTRVTLPIEFDEYVTSITVDDFTETNNISNLTIGSRTFYCNGKILFTSDPLYKTSNINFTTHTKSVILKASPVIISSLINNADHHFTAEAISDYAKTIIEATETVTPTKWNK